MKKIIIEVRKPKPYYGYVVRINNDIYEMDDNASSPNGVNQYAGDISDIGALKGKLIDISTLSNSTKQGIINRLIDIMAE